MRTEKGGKLNNQGLTLLELLIAVIVLAIIVVPFLNAFVISASTNGRAARTHRATSVAQNLVEGFKAGSFADVIRQINYPQHGFSIISPDSLTGSPENSVSELTRLSGTGGATYVKSLSAEEIRAKYPGVGDQQLRERFLDCNGTDGNARRTSIFSLNGGKDYEFIPQYDADSPVAIPEEGKYYFSIKGIRMQGSAFDALICLDSSKYKNGGSVKPENRYNDEETVRLMGMDDTRDAIFVQPAKMDETAISELKLKYPEKADQFKPENFRRKITLSIETSGAVRPIHKVRLNCLYTFIPDGSITFGKDKDYQIYNNSETGEELRAIYLYYYPWYNTGVTDEIVIYNGADSPGHPVGNGSLPVKLYIVKQESGDISTLNDREMHYSVSLSIVDDKSAEGNKAVHESLRTNLEQNLYQAYMPEGSVLTPSSVNYTLNGTPVIGTDKKDNLNWKQDMSGSEPEDRIYELTVRVYEEGAADSNFPDAELLTEILAERND